MNVQEVELQRAGDGVVLAVLMMMDDDNAAGGVVWSAVLVCFRTTLGEENGAGAAGIR